MPTIIKNPFRGRGMLPGAPPVVVDAAGVASLLARCPKHAETPLRSMPELASEAGVSSLFVKDESGRMGLGSFKALGAAHVVARDAEASSDQMTYVAASAGNHGLSLAAGARVFGARAVIYLAESVPEAFAERLRAKGAEVRRAGAVYEESMAAAEDAAEAEGMTLLSDSTWQEYVDPAIGVMEGYLQMAEEAVRQLPAPPTHILLQAGVGGMAASVAAYIRKVWGDNAQIIIVEPEAAPALAESIRAGHLVTTDGPVSDMGRLDCKTPSLVALASLSRDADAFATISEGEAHAGVKALAQHGLATTTSGGAGIAALIAGLPNIPRDASILAFMSEGPEDG